MAGDCGMTHAPELPRDERLSVRILASTLRMAELQVAAMPDALKARCGLPADGFFAAIQQSTAAVYASTVDAPGQEPERPTTTGDGT